MERILPASRMAIYKFHPTKWGENKKNNGFSSPFPNRMDPLATHARKDFAKQFMLKQEVYSLLLVLLKTLVYTCIQHLPHSNRLECHLHYKQESNFNLHLTEIFRETCTESQTLTRINVLHTWIRPFRTK